LLLIILYEYWQLFCELLSIPIANKRIIVPHELNPPEVIHNLNLQQLFISNNGDSSTFITIFHLHKLSYYYLIVLFTITNFFKLCNPILPEQLLLFKINNTISSLDNPLLFQKFYLNNINYYNYINNSVHSSYDELGLDINDSEADKILMVNRLVGEYDYDIRNFVANNLPTHMHSFTEPLYEEWLINFDWKRVPKNHSIYTLNEFLYESSHDYIRDICDIQMNFARNRYVSNLQNNYLQYDYVDFMTMFM
jgi:hypothetical protein